MSAADTSGATSFHFLSSLLTPSVASTPTPLDQDAIPLRLSLQARVPLTAKSVLDGGWINLADLAPGLTRTLELYGPGDVAGLRPEQVVRTFPSDSAKNVASNVLPAIELDDADIAWRFTVLKGGNGKQPYPWLAVVCLDDVRPDGSKSFEDVVALQGEKSSAVRVFPRKHGDSATTMRHVLPDPVEAYRWAHVQLTQLPCDTVTDLNSLLHSMPERSVCRLLASKRLRSHANYTCFLVPLFESGRCAALGLPAPTANAFAWSVDAAVDASEGLVLPYYHRWSFETGDAVDFETLVRRIQPRILDPRVGRLRVDLSSPGYERLEVASRLKTDLECVLKVVRAAAGSSRPPSSSKDLLRMQKQLEQLLARAADVSGAGAGPETLVLAPPRYGNMIARHNRDQAWFKQANTLLVHRIAAGVGAALVREHQEDMLDEAWDQLGEWRSSESAMSQRSAATLAGRRVMAKHTTFDVQGADAARLYRFIEQHVGLLDLVPFQAGTCRSALAGKNLLPTPSRTRVLGKASTMMRRVSKAAGRSPDLLTSQHAARVKRHADSLLRPIAVALLQHMSVDSDAHREAQDPVPGQADPGTGIGQARRFNPILDDPLIDELMAMDENLLLPGLALVPDNTVVLLQTNQAFIEALLLGANHELMRELIWREFPCSRTHTAIRRFFDYSPLSALMGVPYFDVEPITDWTEDLGSNKPEADGMPDSFAAVLLHADLVLKYPNVIAYLIPAWENKPQFNCDDALLKMPVIRTRIGSDLLLLGFAITVEQAIGKDAPENEPPSPGNQGYFLILEEKPNDVHFALEFGNAGNAPLDLNAEKPTWGPGFPHDHHLEDCQEDACAAWRERLSTAEWAGSGGALAKATLQRPVRAAYMLKHLLQTVVLD